jgi:hypothetical protein
MTSPDPRSAFVGGMTGTRFVDYFVVGARPSLFATEEQFRDWRRRSAALINVDPASLHIVGSACVGFSLKPTAKLKPFGATSDVDVAVVSSVHFDIAWRHLRNIQHRHFQYREPQATSLSLDAPNRMACEPC